MAHVLYFFVKPHKIAWHWSLVKAQDPLATAGSQGFSSSRSTERWLSIHHYFPIYFCLLRETLISRTTNILTCWDDMRETMKINFPFFLVSKTHFFLYSKPPPPLSNDWPWLMPYTRSNCNFFGPNTGQTTNFFRFLFLWIAFLVVGPHLSERFGDVGPHFPPDSWSDHDLSDLSGLRRA